MKKYVFVDIDGTLYDFKNHCVPESAEKALKQAKENGHEMVVCSGRSLFQMQKELLDLGFSGIGLMDGACHVDIRNKNNYVNAHWYGDERTGNNAISSFLGYLPPLATSQPVTASKHTLAVIFDGKTILEKEF